MANMSRRDTKRWVKEEFLEAITEVLVKHMVDHEATLEEINAMLDERNRLARVYKMQELSWDGLCGKAEIFRTKP